MRSRKVQASPKKEDEGLERGSQIIENIIDLILNVIMYN
jgi:hypothetical protein